ncbi:MAG: sulfotransferase [Phycisphaeraceae bacterium]|nr:sulfotransferase [Phycisphaeraceae bacterium]MCW5755143.1 sulfotransferase [Phycisphaeraceae bacterium]
MHPWQEVPSQAVALVRQGRLEDAQSLCEQTLRRHPEADPVACVLGQVLLQRGRTASAVELLGTIVAEKPDSAPYRVALARALVAHGRHWQAVEHLREAERLAPQSPQVRSSLAEALLACGDREGSHDKLLEALDRVPAQAEPLAQFADFARRLGSWQAMHAAAERWSRAVPADPAAWSALGEALGHLHRLTDAIVAFEKAMALGAPAALYHARIAELAEHANDLPLAQERAERALKLDPDLFDAAAVFARVLRRRGSAAEARDVLRATIRRAESIKKQLPAAHVGLAQALDALGEYDEAFKEMTTGQDAWSRTPLAKAVSREFFPRLIREYRTLVASGACDAWGRRRAEGARPAPVFFVGFPRSGTTLTEQVLGAHPALAPTDERPFVRSMADRLRGMFPDRHDQGEALRCLDEAGREALEAVYWRGVERHFGPGVVGSRRVFDKLPMNTCWLPLIRRVFPDAKVLFAVRDPRDVVLSCFFQEFAVNEANVHFMHLRSTAELYAQVMGLWMICRDRLALDWRITRYEEFVNDVEGSARALLEWLGLEWNDDVLRFADPQRARLVRTASYAQVARPVHREAVARWKRYARHLEPVLPLLAPFVSSFGYAP